MTNQQIFESELASKGYDVFLNEDRDTTIIILNKEKHTMEKSFELSFLTRKALSEQLYSNINYGMEENQDNFIVWMKHNPLLQKSKILA